MAILALIGGDIAGALGYGAWAEAEARAHASPAKADAAIVFYTDDLTGDGRRLAKALDVWRAGAADSLYFVGGARATGSGSARQAAAAIAAGAPAGKVGNDLTSFDTETNVESACAAIGQRGWGRVALVSDAMHIVRIRYLLSLSACAATPAEAAPVSLTGFGETWVRAHYEAVAWAVDVLLPPSARAWLLGLLRR